jgi:hypothetical protein
MACFPVNARLKWGTRFFSAGPGATMRRPTRFATGWWITLLTFLICFFGIRAELKLSEQRATAVGDNIPEIDIH